jgi:hypothetical protein
VCRRKEEEERALAEARRTGGISFSATLKPFPTAGLGDRITLPKSALESLTAIGRACAQHSPRVAPQWCRSVRAGALDSASPMAFELRSPSPLLLSCFPPPIVCVVCSAVDHGEVVAVTHAGVAEFTAEEGNKPTPPPLWTRRGVTGVLHAVRHGRDTAKDRTLTDTGARVPAPQRDDIPRQIRQAPAL